MTQGALRRLPYQQDMSELQTTDGVDIVYDLRNMVPSRFIHFVDQLLMAAVYECERYSELEFRYARWVVELNVSGQRRGQRQRVRRDYIAAMSRDTDTMVFGEPGSIATELGGTGKSLADKAEAIINMLGTVSPGAYVSSQNPYKVLRMIISVRQPFESLARRVRAQERGEDLGLIRVRRQRELPG